MSYAVEVASVTTADGETTVLSGRGFFCGFVLNSDRTNDADINVYDGSASTGKKLVQFKLPGDNDARAVVFPFAVRFTTSLTVVVTGSDAEAFVYFKV